MTMTPEQAIETLRGYVPFERGAKQDLRRALQVLADALAERDRLREGQLLHRSEQRRSADRLRDAVAERDKLRAALEDAIDVAVWMRLMSGSADFSPEGVAHEGWLKARPKLYAAIEVLGSVAPAKDSGSPREVIGESGTSENLVRVTAAEGTARWKAVEQVREVVERDGRHVPVPSPEHPDKTTALAALSLLEQLAEAAERVLVAEVARAGIALSQELRALEAALAAVRSGRAGA